jgi:hypothetical protein
MSIVLQATGGGSVTIQEPTTASNFTQTLPAGTGTIAVQGASSNIVSGTPVTASGTAIDFTGIPSWVKRVTVMFSGVSTNGTSQPMIQLGDSGGFETTGYSSGCSIIGTSSAAGYTGTTGFITGGQLAANTLSGSATITLIGSNLWACQGVLAFVTSNGTAMFAGSKTLSDTLDRIRITTVNGTDTFDAGTINILYE